MSVATSEQFRGRRSPFDVVLAPITSRIAGKIIAPYLVLILILALLAAYVVTRLVSQSLQDRFTSGLLNSGTAANEAMVKLETENLQVLRLMSNTEGVADALLRQDARRLEELLLPLQTNARLDLVDVFAADGSAILMLRSDDLRADATRMIDTNLGKSELAQKVLQGETDALGDKFTELVQASWGIAVYTAGPVKTEAGEIAGTILVGTPLERALQRLAREAQASLTVYAADGTVVATTLPLIQATESGITVTVATIDIDPDVAASALAPEPALVRRALDLRTRQYQELIGALEVRTRPVAALGVALPVTFIQQAAFASRQQLTILFGGVVLGVLLLGLSLARAITRPIAALVAATEKVATGDLEQHVPVTTRDETGRLTDSFNHMVEGLREREKVKNMFSQYVTNQVAEAVLRGEVKLGGERQEITVLMSDVRSFTTLSESMDPAELVSMLNRYFDRMIDAIIEFEGVLDKFIGDGIMVEYNCPLRQNRYALRGVLTALRMRQEVEAFNRDQEARGEPTIRIGIGVHTGPAVVGNIGAEGKKVEYTAMGDTVNVAARLESQTKEVGHDIVISAETYAQCKAFVDVGETMSLHVKGRVEPVRAHKLIGLRPGLTLGKQLIAMTEEEVRAAVQAAGGADGSNGQVKDAAALGAAAVPTAPAAEPPAPVAAGAAAT